MDLLNPMCRPHRLVLQGQFNPLQQRETLMYIQANIGRNIANLPMTDAAWSDFIGEVGSALCGAVLDLTGGLNLAEGGYSIERHAGIGTWEGSPTDEESIQLSTFVPRDDITAEDNGVYAMTKLSREIRRIAEWYCQDAIALITSSRLIKPTVSEASKLLRATTRGLL